MALLSGLLFSSCHYVMGKRVRGNGNIRSENRSTPSFSGIEANGNVDVYYTQDSATSIKIETDEDLMPYIETYVDDHTLEIGPRDGYNLRPSGQIKVYISAPSVVHFEASGASSIRSSSKIVNDHTVSVSLSGASDANLEITSPRVEADLSGASTATLRGQTRDFDAGSSGSSRIRGFELQTENARVELSGACSADVFASVNLDLDLSGASTVHYKGNPAVKQSLSGASSAHKSE